MNTHTAPHAVLPAGTPPAARADEPPAQRLVEESVHASGRDNTTALVLEIPSLPFTSDATITPPHSP